MAAYRLEGGTVLSVVVTRIVSAVMLGLPVLAIIYFGRPAFELMVALAAAVMAWEWFGMCGAGHAPSTGLIIGVVLLISVAAAGLVGIGEAFVVLALGAGAILVFARGGLWLTGGVLYLGLPCVVLVWLRSDPLAGRYVVFWLMAVVWASDIGAYAAGRLIGGPRLAPRISPNKTWAGLIGGIGLGALASAAFAAANGHPLPAAPAMVGALLGFVAQAGDLGESWVKRRFGVKDASALIPGHGGLLDRVDGLLAAILVVAFIAAADEGALSRWL
jgi:phosphatidate cytidylyltransferase